MPITLLKKTFMTCSITYFKKQELKKKEEEEEEEEEEKRKRNKNTYLQRQYSHLV